MPPSNVVGVLVVDDESPIREALRLICADVGYPVAEAANGRDALAYLRSNPQPLVVLLDWWMPIMNGLELLRAVADDSTLAKCHVYLLLSAVNPNRASLRAQIPRDLCVRTLRKPFDLDALLAIIAELAAEALALTLPPAAPPAVASDDEEH